MPDNLFETLHSAGVCFFFCCHSDMYLMVDNKTLNIPGSERSLPDGGLHFSFQKPGGQLIARLQ